MHATAADLNINELHIIDDMHTNEEEAEYKGEQRHARYSNQIVQWSNLKTYGLQTLTYTYRLPPTGPVTADDYLGEYTIKIYSESIFCM